MAAGILGRGAVVVAVAGAIKLEVERAGDSGALDRSWGGTDLPRTIVRSGREDGCGSNLTGYVVSGAGMVWTDFEKVAAESVTDCRSRCDSAANCIGFTSRSRRRGMQCNLYKGLMTKYDPRALSYSKCTASLGCANSEGFAGFAFSHQGTWKSGTRVGFRSIKSCVRACAKDRSCVAFTRRHTRDGKAECLHFKIAANGRGPRPDAHATTYSKCLPEERGAGAPAAPALPLRMAVVVPKSENRSCTTGYVRSSRGWWWHEYDKLSEVADLKACTGQCDALHGCVSFVYRLVRQGAQAECYLYRGAAATFDSSVVALTKCGPEAPCDRTALLSARNLNYEFSHHGSWEGRGTQYAGVTLKGCSLICESNQSCSALSWSGQGEVCTTFDLGASAAPRPAEGAEAYAKCSSVDTEPANRLF